MKRVEIEDSWYKLLEPEFEKEYFLNLTSYIRQQYIDKTIYPHPRNIFKAFSSTPVNKAKVVIIGQDPYHGPNQAHGLCFSVQDDVKHPPSLVNIFKEVESDIGTLIPQSGNLDRWADQGVLLLNSTLTVEEGRANSHKDTGWTVFTDNVIKEISRVSDFLIFFLWGAFAQKKEELIDSTKHIILKSVHPSPLSAYNGFFGCKHFSQANSLLSERGMDEILW